MIEPIVSSSSFSDLLTHRGVAAYISRRRPVWRPYKAVRSWLNVLDAFRGGLRPIRSPRTASVVASSGSKHSMVGAGLRWSPHAGCLERMRYDLQAVHRGRARPPDRLRGSSSVANSFTRAAWDDGTSTTRPQGERLDADTVFGVASMTESHGRDDLVARGPPYVSTIRSPRTFGARLALGGRLPRPPLITVRHLVSISGSCPPTIPGRTGTRHSGRTMRPASARRVRVRVDTRHRVRILQSRLGHPRPSVHQGRGRRVTEELDRERFSGPSGWPPRPRRGRPVGRSSRAGPREDTTSGRRRAVRRRRRARSVGGSFATVRDSSTLRRCFPDAWPPHDDPREPLPHRDRPTGDAAGAGHVSTQRIASRALYQATNLGASGSG